MAYSSCPSEVVNAPIELVWALLTEPAGWGSFFDVGSLRVEPQGPARVGQVVRGKSGPRVFRLGVSFEFTEVDAANHRLGIDVELPFDIKVREDLDCAYSSVGSCRVNYRCNFELPAGVRGRMLRLLMGRALDTGPQDSLQRLKASAEARVSTNYRSDPETITVSREEFEGLLALRRRRRLDWPACFSTNIEGQIWPFVTKGYTKADQRENVRGELPFLDELANRFLLLRPQGGRMFLNDGGLFCKSESGAEVLLLAFAVFDGPVYRDGVVRPERGAA